MCIDLSGCNTNNKQGKSEECVKSGSTHEGTLSPLCCNKETISLSPHEQLNSETERELHELYSLTRAIGDVINYVITVEINVSTGWIASERDDACCFC